MEFSTTLKKRISIRDFKNEQVSKEILRNIVSDAQQAPSWANSQPWRVYIATGETMKNIQKSHLKKSEKGLKGSADLPVKDIQDWGKLPFTNMSTWLDKVKSDATMKDFLTANVNLWNAPAMAYLTIPKTTPVWSVYDTGAFAQTLMLSATNRGVDSMVAYENIKYPDEIRENLDIKEEELIIAGIALGYRSEDKINTFTNSRLATEEILTIK
ncbi:nitroreductase [Lactococcus cremoris]|uniref:5,6-dimethylbenzimidazole synthase, bluB n=1 Tax=Lactococcus lactis subsp. cremoris TaxID=1359 RepID=A0ABR5EGI5_LACLC|nr:nitroreductase [Lactococcus cremoris]KKW72493.1 5,6-dimethylbenzimidazole synthase, bluB [Lactococcus cremoris]TNU82557.1 NAD(P)H nitroreductase [Lactococcus cremoris]